MCTQLSYLSSFSHSILCKIQTFFVVKQSQDTHEGGMNNESRRRSITLLAIITKIGASITSLVKERNVCLKFHVVSPVIKYLCVWVQKKLTSRHVFWLFYPKSNGFHQRGRHYRLMIKQLAIWSGMESVENLQRDWQDEKKGGGHTHLSVYLHDLRLKEIVFRRQVSFWWLEEGSERMKFRSDWLHSIVFIQEKEGDKRQRKSVGKTLEIKRIFGWKEDQSLLKTPSDNLCLFESKVSRNHWSLQYTQEFFNFMEIDVCCWWIRGRDRANKTVKLPFDNKGLFKRCWKWGNQLETNRDRHKTSADKRTPNAFPVRLTSYILSCLASEPVESILSLLTPKVCSSDLKTGNEKSIDKKWKISGSHVKAKVYSCETFDPCRDLFFSSFLTTGSSSTWLEGHVHTSWVKRQEETWDRQDPESLEGIKKLQSERLVSQTKNCSWKFEFESYIITFESVFETMSDFCFFLTFTWNRQVVVVIRLP